MMTPLQSASRMGWSEERLKRLRQMCRMAGISEVEFSFVGYAEVPVRPNYSPTLPPALENKWIEVSIRWWWASDEWKCVRRSIGIPMKFSGAPREMLSSARLLTDVPGGDW